MKKLFHLIPIMVLALVGCQNIELMPDSDVLQKSEFSAQVEVFDVQTKTSLGQNRMVVWSENDQIAIFQGSSLADKFQVKASSVGNSNGVFSYVSTEVGENGDYSAGNETDISTNVAVYPYQDNLDCLPIYNGSVLTSFLVSNFNVPVTQNYVINSFSNGVFPMVAVTSGVRDHKLNFKNMFGVLKLQLKGDRVVKSISVTGKNNEVLAGNATISAYLDGSVPVIIMDNKGAKTVTLDCGEAGVQLNHETPTMFMIALPPVPFDKGFDVVITDVNDNIKTLSTSASNSIDRSMILSMPGVNLDSEDGYETEEMPSANCYIISEAGEYRFKTVKGNSDVSVGAVNHAEVLWESFGTDVTPSIGDLIPSVSYSDGYITFITNEAYKEGNAVIAAKDADGNILWSWHIWMTDQPEVHLYNNSAGCMMDRNLGATSATPGDVGAIGLLYQWGRKDPFLGSSSLSESVEAKSTITWPLAVYSNTHFGNIDYATTHPTTFIHDYGEYDIYDWYYSSDGDKGIFRWTTSDKEKSIYDPCPSGWRVPDGGYYGIWRVASQENYIEESYPFDYDNKGVNFAKLFGTYNSIWYPASGMRYASSGSLDVDDEGAFWSATRSRNNAYALWMVYGSVHMSTDARATYGLSVRCAQDSYNQ